MSLADFQTLLSRLVMEPAFRRRVEADPEPELAAFALSGRERRRLVAVARDGGLKTGTLIHRGFRLSMLSNTLPRTCRALGGRALQELTHAYWRREPPRSLQYVQEALRFAAFARECFVRGELRHELMPEVLDAEVALLELAGEAPARTPPEAETPGHRDRLRLAPGHRLVRFRRDPEALLAALARGGEEPALPEGEHVLLLSARGGSRVAMRTLKPAEGRLALLCDGERSLAEVAGELPAGAPPPERTAVDLLISGVLEPVIPADSGTPSQAGAAIVAGPVPSNP